MVEKTEFEGEEAYRCEACGFHYREKEVAEKCEEYCNKNNICKSEITEKSLERS